MNSVEGKNDRESNTLADDVVVDSRITSTQVLNQLNDINALVGMIYARHFVYSQYRGVTANEWVDIIHMFMVYKWTHRNSRTANLVTRPDIFEMYMNTGSTEKIYVRYNNALRFMMERKETAQQLFQTT